MKAWYQSKTVWFQILTLVAGILLAVSGVVESKTATIILVAAIALINGVLRIYFTDTAIK